MMPYIPPEIQNGKFVDTASGLIVPNSYRQYNSLVDFDGSYRSIPITGFNQGYPLERDADTMVIKWPAKGSIYDDIACDCIVDGNISNVGIAPTISPMISALVAKQQNQAVAATIELTGRKTPVRVAHDAISRFNDSPLGATSAMQRIVRNMRTHNRGQPIATIPIHFDMDVWEEHGLIPHEIEYKGKPTKTYYLEVDWAKHGTPIPFLPDSKDLQPTGNDHWPYWYRAKQSNKRFWVLLHQTQIIVMTPGESARHGIGTSSVWMALGKLAEEILVMDERVEKKITKMAEGLIGIGPVFQNSDQIESALKQMRKDDKADGKVMARGYYLLTHPQKGVNFSVMAFRQHDGVEFKDRREEFEDTIAVCFDEPLTALVTRGGVGYGSQADTVAELSSEGGVMGILNRLGIALGLIYRKVQVRIVRPNDRAMRQKIDTFTKFGQGIQALHGDGQPKLHPAEVRAMIENYIFDIPEISEDIIGKTATHDDPEDKERSVGDAPESPEPEPTKQPNPDAEDADGEDDELSAMLRLCDWNEWTLERLEPVIPEGSDEPLPEIAPNPQTVSTNEFDRYWSEDDDYPEMLEAEVVQTEEEIEDTGVSRWVWVAGVALLVYILRDGTRRVERAETVAMRNAMPDQRIPDTDRLAEMLANGTITLAEYNRLLKMRVEEAYTNQGRLGRGGDNAMTEEDYALLTAMLILEFAAIDDFTNRIGQGLYTQAQITNYSRNFIHGSVTAYERMNAHAHGLMTALPQYPGDCQTRCCKGCKCTLDIRQLTGNENFDVYWMLGRADHCADCLRQNARWNPLRIRNGIIQ